VTGTTISKNDGHTFNFSEGCKRRRGRAGLKNAFDMFESHRLTDRGEGLEGEERAPDTIDLEGNKSSSIKHKQRDAGGEGRGVPYRGYEKKNQAKERSEENRANLITTAVARGRTAHLNFTRQGY